MRNVAQGEILTNKHGSPHAIHLATQIASQINTQERRADNHCNTDDDPLRQVGVNNRIEHAHEERVHAQVRRLPELRVGLRPP
jgi:hypothetical protein